jgi:hypothetical protein
MSDTTSRSDFPDLAEVQRLSETEAMQIAAYNTAVDITNLIANLDRHCPRCRGKQILEIFDTISELSLKISSLMLEMIETEDQTDENNN